MGTRYVVAVMRVEDVEGTEYATRDTTLFEATMTDPGRLARFAPVEVLEVLATESGSPVAVVWPAERVPGAPVATGGVITDGPIIGKGPDPAELVVPEAPKRKRRTKAEMDAARATSEARLNGEPEPGQSVAPAASMVGADLSPWKQAALDAMAPNAAPAASPWPQAPGKADAPDAGILPMPAGASQPPSAPAQEQPFNPFQ